MKIILSSFLIASICFACTNDTTEKAPEKLTVEQTSSRTGMQKDYYPSGQLKMSGKLNNEGQKDGVWTSYFENGQKNSEANFKNGVNHGYSMVWYPNGNVRYFGDYNNGKKVGEWIFYTEDGEVAQKQLF